MFTTRQWSRPRRGVSHVRRACTVHVADVPIHMAMLTLIFGFFSHSVHASCARAVRATWCQCKIGHGDRRRARNTSTCSEHVDVLLNLSRYRDHVWAPDEPVTYVVNARPWSRQLIAFTSTLTVLLKGENHPKMITSCLIVFGALSRMVKVRGAYDKPFWICQIHSNH